MSNTTSMVLRSPASLEGRPSGRRKTFEAGLAGLVLLRRSADSRRAG